MPQIVIENPILNSPYREPTRHFRFDASNEITNIIDAGRRGSSYFLPIGWRRGRRWHAGFLPAVCRVFYGPGRNLGL